MADITLRVLDGADRGRIFDKVRTPLTIGREEGNPIQLNDERISRFHVKIQEDHDKVVLTDLESTNGTKVNGESIQLRILRFGDMISVGRSVLLFGSPEQIASRLCDLRRQVTNGDSSDDLPVAEDPEAAGGPSLEEELCWSEDPDAQATLHALQPPELPERMSPGQAAQLSELLEYLHLRFRLLLSSAKADENAEKITLDVRQWQSLLDLQARLAKYLRSIGEPE